MEPGPPREGSSDISRVFREEYGRVVAGLVRVFGDIDLAEEAVQEAFTVACQTWPARGMPPNPGGWITTTARNRGLDRIRRESSRAHREHQSTVMHEPDSERPRDTGAVTDDRLRLIFTCCHPCLAPEAQIALTLRLLGGLTTPEIARGFLVPETTMQQRLTRAKRKIQANHVPYRVPTDAELPDRLASVLRVVYLIFNEGYTATTSEELVRDDLCEEAIRLARLLVELMPDEPEALGLLALLLLIAARRTARTDAAGDLVLLADQDRSRWDGALSAEGHELVRRCLRRNRPGPYQIQAAINAVHTDAALASDTDWRQIVTLYDQHLALAPSPVVRLNRAIALAEADGATAGLAEIDAVALDGYQPFHVARAEMLRRLGRTIEAAAELDRAIELTGNAAERRFLERRRAEIG